ncbi:hypothetical protein SAMN05421858_1936 [Haladaptatus litoreus]|uniref:DUF7344 domain-containing protein n=1 Tax=Haladaptatus litoreus TaxID=553468 RepID=A0A1N6Z9V7_9EURY|nr:helix-turn-helix transcriptional regulator [Haladaptatus litoreus]SIR23568.1 hypothetical protein SAMN05421858_1936 [Haladaptatus litoreus]
MAETRDDQRDDRTAVRRRTGITSSFRRAIQTLGLNALLRLPPEVYDALSSEHRRTVIGYLHENDGKATMAELATHLVTAGVESDEKRARTALRHIHLPKLAEGGLVEWVPHRETVVFGCLMGQ